jgi:Arc/MetJ-type ribon-helix-helix transcriptional regulator
MSSTRDETRITIRFPRQMADAIKQLAVENDRSINSEVVRAAREYIARQRRKRAI